MLLLLLIIPLATGEFRILDYTNSQLATFNTGWTKIQNGTYKIIHTIDTDEYQRTLNELNSTIRHKITPDNSLLPFLLHEMSEIQSFLSRLKPKVNKRSINAIGTAWKWLTGSPDHEDLVMLENHINNLLENNNNQLIINRAMSGRINNITEVSNKIFKILKDKEDVQHDMAVNIKFKLQLIKDEIININYAIHWAKVGIVNSYIFSNVEMKLIKEIIEKNNIPFTNIEEAFEFSNVKIASSNSKIVYLIEIPITDNNLCESLLIKAIKKGNRLYKIPFEKIIRCQNKIFGKKSNCKEHNEIKICTKENIVDISNSTCIPHLLKSRSPSCITINNQHIPTVLEVLPGIILLNRFNDTVHIDKEKINLTGSFAIQYHNSTIIINNQTFLSKEISSGKPLPAVLQPNATLTAEEELLSLEMMKELHLKNINYIETLKIKD
ncbi:uncharacterized protein LOC128870575 [Anastrepha ludens]|uniref:uncharacterized protein LOC128870575 n=1 Tax=Anastrepha ludens TaxID=28586 RepID=UPI0023AF1AF4|nr:uncharacterized protein LOC128870575 [Anastrepha ludens]